MKKIKFCGYYKASNKVVYGDLMHTKSGKVCIDGYLVEPDSVVQFVGYDENGKEVYEDDVLVDDEGNEYIASLDANLNSTKDESDTFGRLTLVAFAKPR